MTASPWHRQGAGLIAERIPTHPEWNLLSDLFKKFTETYGSPELLMRLAPFGGKEVSELKADIIAGLADYGYISSV